MGSPDIDLSGFVEVDDGGDGAIDVSGFSEGGVAPVEESRPSSPTEYGASPAGGMFGYGDMPEIQSAIAARAPTSRPIADFLGQTAAETLPLAIPPVRAAKWAVPGVEAVGGTIYDLLADNIQLSDVPGELLSRVPTYYGLTKAGDAAIGTAKSLGREAVDLGRKGMNTALGTTTKRVTQAYEEALGSHAIPEGIRSEILTDLKERTAILEDDLFYAKVGSLDEAFNISKIRLNQLGEEMAPLVKQIDDALEPARKAVVESGAHIEREVLTPRADKLLAKVRQSGDVSNASILESKLNEAKKTYSSFDNSFQTFLDTKRALYNRINWHPGGARAEQDANALWTALSLDLKDNLELVAKQNLSPEDFAKFSEINKKMGAYLDLQEGLPRALGASDATSLMQAKTPLTALANVGLATGSGAAVGGLMGGAIGAPKMGAMAGAALGFGMSTPKGQILAGKALTKYGQQVANSSMRVADKPLLLSLSGQALSPLVANITGVKSANAEVLPVELSQDPSFLKLQTDMRRVPEEEGLQLLSSFIKDSPSARDYFEDGPIPGYTTVQDSSGKWRLLDPEERVSYAEYVRKSEPDVVMRAKKLNALNDRGEVILGGRVEKPRTGEAQEMKSTKVAEGTKRQEYSY